MTALPRRSLHEDEGGQISALAVLSAMVFACLLLLVVNTGHATNGKIQLQNASDATAISSATWVARGLNLISLNNVTETQLVAIALIIPALKLSFQAAETTLRVQAAAAAAIPFIGGVLSAIIQAQAQLANGYARAAEAAERSLVGQNRSGALWVAARALHTISTVVRTSFLGFAEAESIRVGKQNGAELAILVPARLSPTLPVHDGAFRPDLCDPMRSGSPTAAGPRGYSPLPQIGYPAGEGPFEVYSNSLKSSVIFYSIVNSFVHIYFEGFREQEYYRACGGSRPRPTQQPASAYECFAQGVGTAAYSVMRWRTRLFEAPQPFVTRSQMEGKPEQVPPPYTRACSEVRRNPPEDTRREIVEVIGNDENGNPIRRYRYEVTEYQFLSAMKPGPPSSGGSGSVDAPQSNDPRPYLLGGTAGDDEEKIRRELRFLGLAYRSQTTMVAPKYFQSPFGEHRLAYAQTKVYNATAFDTFTQDWRVALEPADMLEDGGFASSAISKLGNSIPGASLIGRGVGGVIGFFNNH